MKRKWWEDERRPQHHSQHLDWSADSDSDSDSSGTTTSVQNGTETGISFFAEAEAALIPLPAVLAAARGGAGCSRGNTGHATGLLLEFLCQKVGLLGFPCKHARCFLPGGQCSTERDDSKS